MSDEQTTDVARVCWHDELLTDPCQECEYDAADGRCNGSSACTARFHEHGCYSDRDGSACTDPADREDNTPGSSATPTGGDA